MIEDYKKYLVIGYLRFYNPSVYNTNEGYVESGLYIEEVWGTDRENAIRAWERKVVPWGSFFKESFDVEVREI